MSKLNVKPTEKHLSNEQHIPQHLIYIIQVALGEIVKPSVPKK